MGTADWKDKLEDKVNDAENKMHEMKGRAKQKNHDMQQEENTAE